MSARRVEWDELPELVRSQIVTSWGICFIIGAIFGAVIGAILQ